MSAGWANVCDWYYRVIRAFLHPTFSLNESDARRTISYQFIVTRKRTTFLAYAKKKTNMIDNQNHWISSWLTENRLTVSRIHFIHWSNHDGIYILLTTLLEKILKLFPIFIAIQTISNQLLYCIYLMWSFEYIIIRVHVKFCVAKPNKCPTNCTCASISLRQHPPSVQLVRFENKLVIISNAWIKQIFNILCGRMTTSHYYILNLFFSRKNWNFFIKILN